MIFIFVCAVILVGAFVVVRLAMRAPSRKLAWKTVWPVAGSIGALRVGAIIFGAIAYSDPGLGQGLGYFLLMLGLPEILFASGLRSHPREWMAAASAILAVSSFAWAAAIVWIAKACGKVPASDYSSKT